ncbi:unnamed protein product [Lota lota]
MYEAPPCERAAIKVPPQPIDLDFIYLDRSSDQVALQRQAAPPQRQTPPPPRQPVPPQRRGAPPQRLQRQYDPPQRQASPPQRQIPPPMRQAGAPTRPTKLTPTGKVLPPQWEAEVFHDPSINNPPEVYRQEKPGKNGALKRFSPPPVPRAPLPALPPDTEEDVYVDPNEEQGDSDGVYLKPTAAFPLSSRGPMRLPLPVSPSVAPPAPMFIPPSPPTVDQIPGGDFYFNKKFNANTLVSFIFLYLFELNLLSMYLFPTAFSTGMKSTKATGNEDNEWFTGDCKRKHAEDLLLKINKDGAFLIRPSSSQDPQQPYTLAVLYREKVYNIPIRFVVEMQGYALGKVGKDFEDTFQSLQDIIVHHKNNQLVLIDSMSQSIQKTYLVHPARP